MKRVDRKRVSRNQRWFKEFPWLKDVLRRYSAKQHIRFNPVNQDFVLKVRVEKVDMEILNDRKRYKIPWGWDENPLDHGLLWLIRSNLRILRARNLILRQGESIADRLTWLDRLFVRYIVEIDSGYWVLPVDEGKFENQQRMGTVYYVKIYKVPKDTTIGHLMLLWR